MSIVETDILYGIQGPTGKQKEFRDLPKLFKLFGGGVGSGKTWTICAEALRLTLLYRGNRGFICRQEGKALKNTTLVTLLKIISQIEMYNNMKLLAKHNRSEQSLYFTNQSVIMYGGLSKSEKQDNIKSLEIGFFCVDEGSEITPESFYMLKARLRWVLPNGTRPRYCGFLASNPENCWLIPTFVEAEKRHKDFGFVMSLTKDNPLLDEDYEQDLRSQNPSNWVEQYLDGNWRFSEGRVWPEFDPNIHCYPNQYIKKLPAIPHDAFFILALDHGQRHPTVALAMYRDKMNNLFVYDEYYKTGVVSYHIKMLKSKFRLDRFAVKVLDPKSWDKRSEKDGRFWSVGEEYISQGINVTPANNQVDLGLSRVADLLHVDPKHKHPITGQLGAPRLYINSNTCPHLVEEMLGYKCHKTREGIYLDKPSKNKDDTCDSIRYGVMELERYEYEVPKPPISSMLQKLYSLQEDHVSYA